MPLEENEVVPIFVWEIVSHRPGGEYDQKQELYAQLGLLYYLIYNLEFWQRDRPQPFKLYKLENSVYQLQIGKPYWMPKVGLGIGRYRGSVGGLSQKILTWYDAAGDREQGPEERERQRTEQERLAKEQAQQRVERLEEMLRSQGIDPDQLPDVVDSGD